MTRQILATSGGFLPRVNSGGARPGGLIKRALELTGVERPRITLVMTASGDDPGYLSLMYSALGELNCVVDHLALFPMPNHVPEEIISKSDVIWAGGGSMVNLLATYATDDRTGILFQDTTAVEVITDLDVVDQDGPAGYRIELIDGAVVETRLPVGPIN